MSLVAHYKLNSDATDSSDSGHDGSWVGTEAYAAGKIGNAASFDGASYIDCGGRFAPTGAFSLAFWLWVAASANARPISQLGSSEGDFFIGFVDELALFVRHDGTNRYRWNATGTISLSAWNHVALIYPDDGSVTWVINGQKEVVESPVSSGAPSGSTNLLLGALSTSLHTGLLDDVRIYNGVLNDGQAAAIYNGGDGTELAYPWRGKHQQIYRRILAGAAA